MAPLPTVDRSVPAAYRNAPPSLPRPAIEWWRDFGSDELDRLQEMALANNRDLKVAIARVAQAEAQARVAQAARFPVIEGYAKAETEAPEAGRGSAEPRSPLRSQTVREAGLRASYEVDLWGKQGYAVDSALAQALTSVHQREVVALTLTADVASTYFEYLSLLQRTRIAELGLQNRRSALAAMEKRLKLGDATVAEIAQHLTIAATAESSVAALAQRRERAFNKLAILSGISPAELRLEPRNLGEMAVPLTHPGSPADLACRRPDIRRAEAQLASARFDVLSLRASLFPSLTVTGETGYAGYQLSRLINPAGVFYLAAGTLAQTLFDAGRKENQIEVAHARHQELIEQYAGTVLTALKEVEDSLATVRLTEDQRNATASAATTARLNYALGKRSFDLGATDQLALLDAERSVHSNEDAAVTAQFDRLRAAVDLYKSLGAGGRQESASACGA